MAETTAQYPIHQPSLGDHVGKGWYYFGVSVDTRKKLFVFLENAAEVMTHDAATEYLKQEKQKDKRRLSENELQQVEDVLKQNDVLRELAVRACRKNPWVQSATTFGEWSAPYKRVQFWSESG